VVAVSLTSPDARPEPLAGQNSRQGSRQGSGQGSGRHHGGQTSSSIGPVAFTRSRRREGYDIAEVDAYLAELKQALCASERKINQLQGDLNALRLRAHLSGSAGSDTRREASAAAARLLEITASSTDQEAAESRAAAELVLATARQEADALLAAARVEAERLAADLDQRTQQAADLEQQGATVIAETAHHQTAWQARREGLNRWEADQRALLRRYLTDQLAQLDEP